MSLFEVHSQEEVDDLTTWVDEHPADIDIGARMKLQRFLTEHCVMGLPKTVVVPNDLVEALDALIEDWCEVLHAHNEGFQSTLYRMDGIDAD